MGKRIITQRRGRGSSTYRAPSHRYNYSLEYPKTNEKLTGTIIRLLHDQARTSPIAVVEFNNKERINIPAPLNIREGSTIYYNLNQTPGSILRLSEIPLFQNHQCQLPPHIMTLAIKFHRMGYPAKSLSRILSGSVHCL